MATSETSVSASIRPEYPRTDEIEENDLKHNIMK